MWPPSAACGWISSCCVTTGLLVVVIVGLLAALSFVSTKSQFEETAEPFTRRCRPRPASSARR